MTHSKTLRCSILALLAAGLVTGCANPSHQKPTTYELLRLLEVAGRQGIATDGERYYVSGSSALYVYSKDGALLDTNEAPFAKLDKPANHIGDISVHDGKLFAGMKSTCTESLRGSEPQIRYTVPLLCLHFF